MICPKKKGLPMRAMLAGVFAAGACLTAAGNVMAQQGYGTASAVPGSGSQAVYSSGIPAQPVVIGTSAGGVNGSLASQGVLISTPAGVSTSAVSTLSSQNNALPYSYWVSAPNPSRIYVQYGSVDQFPFHGRAVPESRRSLVVVQHGRWEQPIPGKILLRSSALRSHDLLPKWAIAFKRPRTYHCVSHWMDWFESWNGTDVRVGHGSLLNRISRGSL